MKLAIGDLVWRDGEPGTLGVILEAYVTKTGSHTCDVLVVLNRQKPKHVGHILYLNQDYWHKVSGPNYLESESRNS